MECKQCGATLAEGAKFCSVCGVKIEKKKQCPHCKKLVEPDLVFCSFCGTQLKDKKNCPNCNKELDAASVFCIYCGAKCGDGKRAAAQSKSVETQKESAATEQTGKSQTLSTYNKVVRYLSPSLLLFASVILLVCSFFIGLTFTVSQGQAGGVSTSMSVIEFLSGKTAIHEALFGTAILDNPYNIIVCVFIVTNMVVAAAMFIIAFIRFITGLINNNDVNIFNWVTISFATFMFTNYLFVSVLGCTLVSKTSSSTAITSITSGAVGKVGLIIAGVITLVAFILKVVAKGKKAISAEKIVQYVLLAVTIASAFVVCNMISDNFIYQETINSSSSASVSGAFGYLMASLSGVYDVYMELPFIMGMFSIIFMAFFTFTIVTTVSAIINDEIGICTIIFNSISLLGAALYLGSAIFAIDAYSTGSAATSIFAKGGIVAVIMCAICLIFSIASTIVTVAMRKKTEVIE